MKNIVVLLSLLVPMYIGTANAQTGTEKKEPAKTVQPTPAAQPVQPAQPAAKVATVPVVKQEAKPAVKFECPQCKMHYDAAGKCTMCNVDLVAVNEKKEPAKEMIEVKPVKAEEAKPAEKK